MNYNHITNVNTDLRTNLDRAVKTKQANGTYTDACATYAIRKTWALPWMHYRTPSKHSGAETILSKVFND